MKARQQKKNFKKLWKKHGENLKAVHLRHADFLFTPDEIHQYDSDLARKAIERLVNDSEARVQNVIAHPDCIAPLLREGLWGIPIIPNDKLPAGEILIINKIRESR